MDPSLGVLRRRGEVPGLPAAEWRAGETASSWLFSMPQGGAEWLRARRMSVGGSTACAILGRSKFVTQAGAVARMVDGPAVSLTLPMRRGTAGERFVRERLRRALGVEIRELGMAVHKLNPWMRASPDGVYDVPGGGLGVVEIKVVSSAYRRAELEEVARRLRAGVAPMFVVPEEHRCQVQYTAGILDAVEILYCVLAFPAPGSAGVLTCVRIPFDREFYEGTLVPAAARGFARAARCAEVAQW